MMHNNIKVIDDTWSQINIFRIIFIAGLDMKWILLNFEFEFIL